MTQMSAFRVFDTATGPQLTNVDMPSVGDGDVLVQIRSAGLTTGLFEAVRAGFLKKLPTTIGYEGAGVVTAVGRGVTRVKPGDRVRIHPTLSCGLCRYCLSDRDQMCPNAAVIGFGSFGPPVEIWERYRDGTLSEYAMAPERQIDKLPDNVDFDIGAKLHYFANALSNLKLGALPPGATVAIRGATGAMAAVTLRLLPLFGVQRVVLLGRSTKRLESMAAVSPVETDLISTSELGDDWNKNGALARRMKEVLPQGADAMMDYMADAEDLLQAMAGLATGGTLVHMGGGPKSISFPMTRLVGSCWRIAGNRNHSRGAAQEVLRLLKDGRIDTSGLITHRHSLADVGSQVALLHSRSESMWLNVVNP